jgi:phenylacetaldehyde dehydrogenase
MGPVINQGQLDKVREFCSLGVQEGGKLLCGGKQPDGLGDEISNGFYWEPTVIGDCTPDMRVVREEVFGPVIVAYSFKDEADAIAKANDSDFGLAASVWSKDIKRAHRVADRLDVGIVWLNDHHRNDPSSPWGGMKDSGVGRENGIEALHEYTQTRSVVVGFDDTPFDWFIEGDARYG